MTLYDTCAAWSEIDAKVPLTNLPRNSDYTHSVSSPYKSLYITMTSDDPLMTSDDPLMTSANPQNTHQKFWLKMVSSPYLNLY